MNTQHQADENAYTPSKISESNLKLCIPIYQRLFVWDDQQISQLLEDLYCSWLLCKEAPKPYYIGAITVRVFDGQKWEVVDGQQRLTFLMLFGCCALIERAYTEEVSWENLLFTDVNASPKVQRIHYIGRKKDQDCLYGILSGHSKELDNPHMDCFCRCWNAFTHGEVDNKGIKEKRFNEANLKEFSRYVFNHTSFLVSLLPEYSSHQLNCIFEKMNSSGRQLEQDEIIKGLFFAKEACEWNSALNTQIDGNKAQLGGGSVGELTFSEILSTAWSGLGLQEPSVSKSGEVKLQETETRQLLLSKPVMLLHVLELMGASFALESMDWSRIAKRDARRLVETFKDVFSKLPDGEIDTFKSMFIGTLTRYRKWMNENIIFKREDDRLDFLDTREMFGDDDTKQIPETQALRQFQSMLYVSSGEEQEWILDAYRECAGNVSKPLCLDLLKHQDNKRRHKTLVELVYRHIDRYWFWRLDYYLWENRKELFKDDKSLKVANQYVFRRNRSIEHVAPQNPKRDSKVMVSDNLRDSFGNLAMISSGQNSSLQNESFEVKRAYVEAFRNGSKSGTVESLKLLKIYEYPEWGEDSVKDHGKAMIDVLIASFPKEVFAGIHAQLEQAKNLFEESPTSP